ncbi:MAG: PPC domain-containing protein, partial [Bradymonadaceae bacterium]
APETGECVNAPDCEASTQCVDDHVCVGGECTQSDEACEVCEGNKGCTYDEETLAVICEENPGGCARSVDCNDDRVCRQGQCVAPMACEPDRYEPNDDFSSATAAAPVLNSGILRANICDGDTDFFELSTSGYGLVRGALVVEVAIRSEDVGMGTLELVLFDAEQTEVARGETDANGRVTLTHGISPTALGTYYASIEQTGDISVAGVRYGFFSDFVPQAVVEACDGAEVLEPGFVSGDTTEGTSTMLQSGCAASNTSTESVYVVTLDERSVATFDLEPDNSAGVDLVMSLRQNCLSSFGELACDYDENRAGARSLRLTLDPGEYTLIIKGARGGSGGAYDLTYGLESIICQPGNAQCLTDAESSICNADGTSYETMACSDGCNDESGLCTRLEGDVCYAAIDASNGYSGEIRWADFNNEYQMPAGSCVPNQTTSSFTDGPDVAYRIRLDIGESLQATVVSPNDFVSMYLVQDCQDAEGRCLVGVNDSNQRFDNRYVDRLVYRNDSDDVMNLYLIADSRAAAVVGVSTIDILVGYPICNDNERRCTGENLEVCSASRLSYDLERSCSFGCHTSPGTAAACGPIENMQCKGAVDIVARGGSFSDLIQLYSNDYNPGTSGCTGQNMSGGDATFFVDADAGDVITAAINAQFDAGIFVVGDCSKVDRTCYAGVRNTGLNRESIQFVAPETGRYYIIAGAGLSGATGRFTVTASVDLPMCAPGTLLGCSDDETLSYCGQLGAPIPYACATGCTGSACDQQTGEICYDARQVFGGESFDISYQERAGFQVEAGSHGGCIFEEDDATAGADAYYRVNLKAGETLIANATGHVSAGGQYSTTYPVVLYMIEACGDIDTCILNTAASRTPRITYTAQEDEEFILVAASVSGSSVNATFNVEIEIFEPECLPGESSCASANELTYCNQFRALETISCTGGCENDACLVPQGDHCGDAIA